MYFLKILLRKAQTKFSKIKANFPKDVNNCNFSLKADDPIENYVFLTNTFIDIVKACTSEKEVHKRISSSIYD